MHGELLAGLLKAAVQDEQFDPALNREIDHRPRRPAFKPDALRAFSNNGAHSIAGEARCRRQSECDSIDAQLGAVVRVELPELDENRTSRFGTGCVAAAGGLRT